MMIWGNVAPRKIQSAKIKLGRMAAFPLVAGLLLSGCSRSDLRRVKDDTTDAAQKTKEAAEAAKHAVDTNGKAKDAAADAKDATKKLGNDVADATKRGFDNAAAKTKQLANDVENGAKKAADKAKQATPDKKDNSKDH